MIFFKDNINEMKVNSFAQKYSYSSYNNMTEIQNKTMNNTNINNNQAVKFIYANNSNEQANLNNCPQNPSINFVVEILILEQVIMISKENLLNRLMLLPKKQILILNQIMLQIFNRN